MAITVMPAILPVAISSRAVRRYLFGGALAALMTVSAAWQIHRYAQPTIPALERISAAPDGHGGAVLELDYSTRLTDQCLTIGVHIMSLMRDGYRTRYEFLTSSLRGGGLGGSVPAFTLVIHIPPGVTSGDWKLINRLDSSCPPLRLWYHDHTSTPVTVRVRDGVVTIPPGQWFERNEGLSQ